MAVVDNVTTFRLAEAEQRSTRKGPEIRSLSYARFLDVDRTNISVICSVHFRGARITHTEMLRRIFAGTKQINDEISTLIERWFFFTSQFKVIRLPYIKSR